MPFMNIGAITTGLQTGLTATGAITPTAGLDISGITGDFTIFIQIANGQAAKKRKIQLEDSVNGFTASQVVAVFDTQGAVSSGADRVISFKRQDIPSCRCGTASAVLRANLASQTAGDSNDIRAWIEY
jgi:hypothetical protein